MATVKDREGHSMKYKKSTILFISHQDPVIGWLVDFMHKRGVKRIAYIMNAKKPHMQKDPNFKFWDKELFEKEGFEVDFVDIEEPSDLEKRLSNADALYVRGGNRFYLLRAMKQSGFDKIWSKLLDKGVMYVGGSAGAMVAGPSIELIDDEFGLNADEIGLRDKTGLGMVDFAVLPHWKKGFEAELAQLVQEKKPDYAVETLEEGQVILIEDGNKRKIQVI